MVRPADVSEWDLPVGRGTLQSAVSSSVRAVVLSLLLCALTAGSVRASGKQQASCALAAGMQRFEWTAVHIG